MMLFMENADKNTDENIPYYQPTFYEIYPEAFRLPEASEDEDLATCADKIPAELPEENGNFEAVNMAFFDSDFPIGGDNEEIENSERFSFFEYSKISERDLRGRSTTDRSGRR